MADALGLETVAEGIEHQAEAAVIAELGATMAQGHLYGEAQPLEDLRHTLRTRAPS